MLQRFRCDIRFAAAPLAVLATWAVFGVVDPFFLTLDNGLNISGQFGALAIVAIGEMLVIVTGGFDISVGSVAALSTVAGALAINAFGAWGIVFLPLTGGVAGFINGWLIGYMRIQPVVTTLGMLLFARGTALLLSGGDQAVSLDAPASLTALGYGDLAGIPLTAILVLAVALLAILFLGYLRLGRRLYMVGSNAQSAELVGVRVRPTVAAAYAMCGLAAGVAGILFLGRAGAGLPGEGSGLELQAIAAAVIGGTALSGGIGAILPVAVGAFFIQSLLNGLNLVGTSPFVAEIVLGLVIICAGLLDFLVRRVAMHRPALTIGEEP